MLDTIYVHLGGRCTRVFKCNKNDPNGIMVMTSEADPPVRAQAQGQVREEGRRGGKWEELLGMV